MRPLRQERRLTHPEDYWDAGILLEEIQEAYKTGATAFSLLLLAQRTMLDVVEDLQTLESWRGRERLALALVLAAQFGERMEHPLERNVRVLCEEHAGLSGSARPEAALPYHHPHCTLGGWDHIDAEGLDPLRTLFRSEVRYTRQYDFPSAQNEKRVLLTTFAHHALKGLYKVLPDWALWHELYLIENSPPRSYVTLRGRQKNLQTRGLYRSFAQHISSAEVIASYIPLPVLAQQMAQSILATFPHD